MLVIRLISATALEMSETQPEYLLGIDLGGTKIEAALIRSDDITRPLARMRLPTESDKGYEHIVSQIVKLCDLIQKETGLNLPAKVGIGTPGITDAHTGTIKNSNTACLRDRPLRADLERRLGREVVMTNDANCFALAEATWGSARGYDNVFGVIMGTGCGAGIVINGKVINGRHGIAGEWGQIVLDPGGPTSTYGTNGTVESFISGTGIENYYNQLSGRRLKVPDIVALARRGEDEAAIRTLGMLKEKFSTAISIIMCVLDPDAIVLGGGVGNVDELYSEEVRELIRGKMFNPTFESAILKPILGDSAGVFGAAMLTLN